MFTVTHIKEIGSTNTELKRMALSGAPSGTVLLADRQTAGRGRMGRQFFSPDGAGVYMSVLFRPVALADAGLLTTLAAVAVARVLDAHGADTRIKWVNDILANGKKLCGILAEGGTYEGQPFAVIGIGVNSKRTAYPEEISQIAVSLEELTGQSLDCARLAEEILTSLADVSPQAPENPRALMDEYRRRSATLGRHVRVCPHSGEPYDGFAAQITDSGSLVVRTPDGAEHTVSSGEVSVRAL